MRGRLDRGKLLGDGLGTAARCLLAGLLAAGAWVLAGRAAVAQTAAEAAKPPLTIAVLTSSRTDLCYEQGFVGAITRLATLEQERINRVGGINGRRVAIRFLDDQRDASRSTANIRAALAHPETIAIVGLSNSNIAKATFDAIGKDIQQSAIPFISDISVSSIYEKIPNVFTTRSSQDDERMPIIAAHVRETDVRRPAFVGIKGALFSDSLGNGLKQVLGDRKLVADHRLTLKDNKLDDAEIRAMVADIKAKNPDLLFLSIGSARTGDVLKQLMASAAAPALFISGRIESIAEDVRKTYPNDMFALSWDSLPELYNDRLRRRIGQSEAKEWVFEGRKVSAAPGWAKGECKERPKADKPEPLEEANLRAIAVGTQYADMIGMIAATLKTADAKAGIGELRAHIAKELISTYADSRGAFKGSFDNWSFVPATRAASRSPAIIMQPRGLGRMQLAPAQFVRLKGDNFKRIDTLYLDIDMIRAHRVDDNEQTFYAEFYLSMHETNKATIDRIEFTNAFLDPKTNDRQITVRTLHSGGRSIAYPDQMRIYQVTGKFLFNPQLSGYPFDTQRFSIDIQPKNGDAPFIVQPPPSGLRDKQVTTDGWEVTDQYVGYDEDFVPILDAYTHEPSIVPFYKASYVWMMKREITDYYLRVVIPLAVILLVAYFSIFIPLEHFEAIITLQVTALLSAVALYLSLPKLDAGTATISDKIFLSHYALVTLMTGISILRINQYVEKRGWLKGTLASIHIVGMPIAVVLIALYVLRASLLEG